MEMLIVDPATHAEVARCAGPDVYGGCPRAAEDGRVLCAGRTVFAQAVGAVREWHVAADAEGCFARTFASVGAVPS